MKVSGNRKASQLDDLVEKLQLHLAGGYRGFAEGSVQLVCVAPRDRVILNVHLGESLSFSETPQTDPEVPKLYLTTALIERFLRQNEFLSPRDYDVRREMAMDARDWRSWFLFLAAFRPNKWAKEKFDQKDWSARAQKTATDEILTINAPTNSQLLTHMETGTPCKVKFEHFDRTSDALATLAETQALFQKTAVKERTRKKDNFPEWPVDDLTSPASFRLEATQQNWESFGFPFYGWREFACLEISFHDHGERFPDQHWHRSCLSEFRTCTGGSLKIEFASPSTDFELLGVHIEYFQSRQA
ncbi:MAG: hypothetical protein AAGM67_15940, partial [Bacteroidota bacterium]